MQTKILIVGLVKRVDLVAGEGIEKVEWIKIEDLANYDIVPPSRILFEKLGYL